MYKSLQRIINVTHLMFPLCPVQVFWVHLLVRQHGVVPDRSEDQRLFQDPSARQLGSFRHPSQLHVWGPVHHRRPRRQCWGSGMVWQEASAQAWVHLCELFFYFVKQWEEFKALYVTQFSIDPNLHFFSQRVLFVPLDETWVGIYTLRDCYPVQETYTKNSSVTTSTRFFNLQLGISDPAVFTPPSTCQSAKPNRMAEFHCWLPSCSSIDTGTCLKSALMHVH